MKRILNVYGTLLRPSSVFSTGFLVLVLGVLTFILWQSYLVSGWQFPGLLAYLTGMLDTALFIWFLVLLALRSQTSAKSKKVLKALIKRLEEEPDPIVRSKIAVGLAKLDLERSFGHHEHQELDDILIRRMQKDEDPLVRSKAAVGLAELELEQEKPAYHQVHNKLENKLFEERK